MKCALCVFKSGSACVGVAEVCFANWALHQQYEFKWEVETCNLSCSCGPCQSVHSGQACLIVEKQKDQAEQSNASYTKTSLSVVNLIGWFVSMFFPQWDKQPEIDC